MKKQVKKSTKEFKIEIGTRFQDNKRDITIIDREYRDNPYNEGKFLKYYKYYCNKCGFECGEHCYQQKHKEECWVIESHLLKGVGCACCAKPSKIVVNGYNDIPTTTPWMIPYFQGGIEEAKLYSCRSKSKIFPICPDCGRIKTTMTIIDNIYRRKNISCINCSDGVSYPNKFAFNILEQLGIDFENEKTFDWCKYLFKDKYRQGYYDFYFKLNKKEYILEMDGELGHGKKVHSMDDKAIEDTLEIDNEKDRLANEHGIEVIRIDCCYDSVENRFEYIKNSILNNETLNTLFDLNKVNWNKCNEFSTNSLIRIASDYKRNNPDMTAKDIATLIKRDNSTVIDWLKQGHELKWCNYDIEKEKEKKYQILAEKTKERCSKVVEIFKDGTSLGVFSSCHALQAKSQELFGTKLLQGHISEVCRGEKELYKGYTFRYLTLQEIEEMKSEESIQII